MELRVWTEPGIERVVCGVSDVTTCRDVIVALARTVGRTGRYLLIETCHGRQRRLPATEPILARSMTSCDVVCHVFKTICFNLLCFVVSM